MCRESLSLRENDGRPAGHKVLVYRGSDKSLAQPGRKQANVSVRME